MMINIRFFLSTNSERSENKVLNNIKKFFDDNGLLVSIIKENHFEIESNIETWQLHIYHILKICNLLAKEWNLSGNIDETFDSWSNSPKLASVKAIHIHSDNTLVYNQEYIDYVNSLS